MTGARRPGADDEALVGQRAALRRHPCHGCAQREEHARWAERYVRLERETEQLQRRVEGRTNDIARQFDRVCALLDELGYLDGDRVTEPGRRLAGIYGELDLLAAECLRAGVWAGLAPAELAACVSALTFESRRPDDAAPPRLPPAETVRTALVRTVRLWGELTEQEQEHRLDFLREPDLGFAQVAWRWASGGSLETVLGEADLTAGDFVRAVKQLLDLLDQLSDVADDPGVRRAARAGCDALRRGVVAYSSVG